MISFGVPSWRFRVEIAEVSCSCVLEEAKARRCSAFDSRVCSGKVRSRFQDIMLVLLTNCTGVHTMLMCTHILILRGDCSGVDVEVPSEEAPKPCLALGRIWTSAALPPPLSRCFLGFYQFNQPPANHHKSSTHSFPSNQGRVPLSDLEKSYLPKVRPLHYDNFACSTVDRDLSEH